MYYKFDCYFKNIIFIEIVLLEIWENGVLVIVSFIFKIWLIYEFYYYYFFFDKKKVFGVLIICFKMWFKDKKFWKVYKYLL